VGGFPNWDVWAEWNGKYRDDVRRFVKGDAGELSCLVMSRRGGGGGGVLPGKGCAAFGCAAGWTCSPVAPQQCCYSSDWDLS
jgi:hypothetical protein